MNLYGFAGGDPVNFSDPFGLCEPMPWCLALASGGSLAVGTGAASLPSVGAAATVAVEAAPVVALGAIGGVLLRPAFPGAAAPARTIPGALVGTDATAVGLPTTMGMGKLSKAVGRLILIGLGVLSPDPNSGVPPTDVRQGSNPDAPIEQEGRPSPPKSGDPPKRKPKDPEP